MSAHTPTFKLTLQGQAVIVEPINPYEDESAANLLFVTRAVNNHADLVNALQGLLDLCHEEGLDDAEEAGSPLIANAKAVIARVQS